MYTEIQPPTKATRGGKHYIKRFKPGIPNHLLILKTAGGKSRQQYLVELKKVMKFNNIQVNQVISKIGIENYG